MLYHLSEILIENKWPFEVIDELLQNLTEQDSEREKLMKKVIKYKDKEGDDREITVGGALKQGEEHPAYKQAKQMTQQDDDEPKGDKVCEEFNSMGTNCLFVKAELKDVNDCRKIVKMTDEKFGRVDILANCAGDTRRATILSTDQNLFDDIIASLKFPFKKQELTSAQIFNYMSDKNESTRKLAAKSVGKVLGNNIKIFSTITNTLAKDKSINDSWRKLPNPVSARNLSNVVEDSVVDSLVSSVIEYYPKLSHRYYALKARWFNKKYLMYWDRNAPLPFQSSKTFTWKEAQNTVVDAYSEFNPNIGNIVDKFFEKNWIHAPVLEGKSPGAFAASTVASVHPFILVNFQGKTRDVSTLAHELGHGVHQYLAGKNQTHFNASTPLTLAETASVFGEMLTFKSILEQANSKKERKALLANKVEDMLNTVIRQIAFFQFEKEVHTLRKNTELSIDQICSIWMDVQKASLGPSIKYEEEYKYFWSYIPHFIHSPFYVYAYAFGDCLVNSLFNTYEQGLINFDDKYINLLKSGGSKKYDELFSPFNLNLSKKSFWKKGLNVIESYIDELETL